MIDNKIIIVGHVSLKFELLLHTSSSMKHNQVDGNQVKEKHNEIWLQSFRWYRGGCIV